MPQSLNQRERAIREKRTIEATRKNIMGPSGKLGLIARYLGSPIIFQGSTMADSRTVDEYLGETYDVYAEHDPNELPTFDERDSFIDLEGYTFDGLSRGMHLEIKYVSDSHSLTVYYKGYPVYVERAGELFVYAPFEEWEGMIDRLYVVAHKKHEEFVAVGRAEDAEKAEKAKSGFLHMLRTRWGL